MANGDLEFEQGTDGRTAASMRGGGPADVCVQAGAVAPAVMEVVGGAYGESSRRLLRSGYCVISDYHLAKS